MILLVLAAMAALAAGFVLLALFARADTRDAGHEARMNALKAELAEAERDRAQGRTGEHEYELLRAEIARRLFALEDAAPRVARTTRLGRPALIAGTVLIPVLAFAIYAGTGSPGMASAPLAERTDVRALLARVEKRLRDAPNDARGWLAVAPIYARLGEPAKAATAYERALATADHPPRRRSALLTEQVELQTVAAGQPVAPARAQLEEAVRLDKENVKARFLLALADEETAPPEDAARSWRALLDRYPDATEGWTAIARQRLARLDIATGMPAAERGPRIEAMVASLAERLEADPDDIDGWVRLVRSYAVLGRAGAARSAYERGRAQFAGDETALAKLAAEAKRNRIAVE